MKLGVFTLLLGLLLSTGCRNEAAKKEKSKEAATQQQIVHKGESYTVALDPSWTVEDPKPLNSYADFAASKDEVLFFLIIPQPLPALPDVPAPTALDLKRASVHVMEQEIDKFEVELQGPVNVDGQLGQTVVAHGHVEKDHIKYVTTYFAVGKNGYQIVAWGPFSRGDELLKEADKILATLKFPNASKEKSKPADADAGSGETDASTK